MTGTTYSLEDLEARVTSGDAFTRHDAERVLAATDLVSVGVLGESARRRRSGDRVTFGRVAVLTPSLDRATIGQAGEVRVLGTPGSLEEALGWVQRASALAGDVPLTAFNLADLMSIAGPGDGLLRVAAALRAAGLDAIAELPLDRLGPAPHVVNAVRALEQGGLGVWRATVDRAPLDERLNLVELAAEVQASTGALRAFAPLPRLDPADVPSTGYDDVRTVAIASLLCADIGFIQVDWPLYGPKLAQVAIAFGANDIDGIAAVDAPGEGPRRAPVEDITRQIRAASGQPAERNGKYEIRS